MKTTNYLFLLLSEKKIVFSKAKLCDRTFYMKNVFDLWKWVFCDGVDKQTDRWTSGLYD